MEGTPNPSHKSVRTPSEILFDSMNQSPVKHTLIKSEACDVHSREHIENALRDPIARIPSQFKSAFHKFLYYNQKKYLQQVNHFAQLAFLIYFWADRYVLPDVEVLSGVIRVIAIIGAFGLNFFYLNTFGVFSYSIWFCLMRPVYRLYYGLKFYSTPAMKLYIHINMQPLF